MANLEENTSLIVALSEIEKKVVQAETDRNNLKTNLTNKGVDVSGTYKMQGLVEKVNEIEVERHNIPKWYNFSDKWIKAENCINKRWLAVVESVGDYLYVIGGRHDINSVTVSYSNLNQQYDIKNNTWINKAPLPIGRESMCSGVVGNKIYIIGGRTSSEGQYNIIHYDTNLDVWTETFKTPESREYASSCVYKDNIYIMGGANKGTYIVGNVYVYNTTIKTWTEKSKMSKNRYSFSSAVFGDYIYIFDKWEVAQYNIALDVWTDKSSPPKSISNSNSVHTIKNKIFAISNDDYSLRFDPISEIWVNTQVEIQGRRNSVSGTDGKYFFLIGGEYISSSFKSNMTTLYIPLEN